MAELLLAEGAAPGTPSAGKVTLYAKADGLLYSKDDAGAESPLGVAGSGLTSLNGENGTTQTFDDVNDTNVTLTISSSGDVHTFTLGWTGLLALARLVHATGASRLLGRGDSGAGVHQEITLGSGLAMTGTVLSSTGGVSDGDKGDITVSSSGATWTIDNDAVTYAKLQDVTDARVLGRAAGSTGNAQELSAGAGITIASGAIASSITQYTDELAQDATGAMVDSSLVYVDATPLLTRAALTGDVTASQGSNATTIANDAVTNAKLANIATARIKGRVTASTGDLEDLTGTQATTLLDTFTDSLKGLAPLSGGGTTNFLRADGTWAAPAGSGQTAVQMKDEGSNLGTSGTVDVIDFVGAGVVATRASNTLTVTVAGGSGITQDQVLNLASLRA